MAGVGAGTQRNDPPPVPLRRQDSITRAVESRHRLRWFTLGKCNAFTKTAWGSATAKPLLYNEPCSAGSLITNPADFLGCLCDEPVGMTPLGVDKMSGMTLLGNARASDAPMLQSAHA